MTDIEEQKLEALADRLVATLGDVSPKDADETVRKVALVIYNDLLGIEGEIQTSGFRLCMAGTTSLMTNVKFVPRKEGDSE